MKKLLVLIISAISLTGCDLLGSLSDLTGDLFKQPETDLNENNDNEQTQQDDQHQEHDDDHSQQQDDDHGQQQDDDDHGQQQDDGTYQYTLEDYTNFEWHNGHKPCYAPDWEYHIKGTVNPLQSAFWENPNENVDYSGVIFKDRNSYIISPTFNSWKKVEIKFTFWLSANNKDATKDAPQMYIEEYSATGQLLGKEEVNIARSDVPSNNSPLVRTYYIKNTSMHYFILRHNNYVYNGSGSAYYVVLSEARLKGWDYE